MLKLIIFKPNKTVTVINNETKEKVKGTKILTRICFKGDIGIYLIIIAPLPSLEIDKEAEVLITPTNKRIKQRLIPEINSGK